MSISLVTQGTNMSTPALPTIIEHRMVALVGFALAVNEKFHYDRFFQTMPYGPDGKDSITRGFFDAAMSLDPKPQDRRAARRRFRFRAGVARRRAAHSEAARARHRL